MQVSVRTLNKSSIMPDCQARVTGLEINLHKQSSRTCGQEGVLAAWQLAKKLGVLGAVLQATGTHVHAHDRRQLYIQGRLLRRNDSLPIV